MEGEMNPPKGLTESEIRAKLPPGMEIESLEGLGFIIRQWEHSRIEDQRIKLERYVLNLVPFSVNDESGWDEDGSRCGYYFIRFHIATPEEWKDLHDHYAKTREGGNRQC